MAKALYGIQQQNISADDNRLIDKLEIRAIYKLNDIDMSGVSIYSNCLIVLKDGKCVDLSVPQNANTEEIIRIYPDLCDSEKKS